MRVLLVVAYDGTSYHGWQAQKTEEKTIEGVLNKTLSALTGENISVIGASRTDAGVHAKGNIAVFDTNASIPAASYAKALNGRLPWDIRIIDSYRVNDDFHPRHTDTRKTYCYRIFHGDVCLPYERLYSYHIYGPINIDSMVRAAKHFEGEHDFAAFCAVGAQTETTVRTIYNCTVNITQKTDIYTRTMMPDEFVAENEEHSEYKSSEDYVIEIFITGSGFLYNMVRIIAGTLLEVGRGRIQADDIPDIINSCDRNMSGPTLPAMGLMLEKYEFMQ